MGGGTGLGRVRGLGSAKGGAHHWTIQRVTAIGNMLLVTWLLVSLVLLPDHGQATVAGWLGQTLVAVPMMLLLVSAFWHQRLGMQVMIEDYVHDEGLKFATLVLMDFYAVAMSALGIFCVAKIAFAGGAA